MNCEKHLFPSPEITSRGDGEFQIVRCNNCLAVKVVICWKVNTPSGWQDRDHTTIIPDPR